MSFILHPINYAIQRTVNAVLKTPESGARVTGQTVDDNVATRVNLQPEELAFDPDRGFKPTFYTGLKRPRTNAEAQNLYNHMRTIAWYSDALPLLSSWLPFNIGIEGLLGLIPYVGDFFGLIIGVYLICLAALFGMPLQTMGIMAALVIVDTTVGLVPIIGDAIDVAFKSNLYILALFEHQLTSKRGKCGAGEFQIVMPPSGKYMPSGKPRKARVTPQPAASQRAGAAKHQPQAFQSNWASNPEDDPPEVAPGYSYNRQDFCKGATGYEGRVEDLSVSGTSATSTRRAVPEAEVCDLPAVPLSLPAEFMSSEGRREGTGEERARLLDPERRASITDSLPSPLEFESESAGSSDESDGGEGGEGDEDLADEQLVFDALIHNAASSPIGPRLEGRPRSVSRSRRRPRGVSWHADIAGGGDDDEEDDREGRSLIRRSRHISTETELSTTNNKARRARYLMIFSAIFAIAYVTSLDSNTGFLYLNFACSEFGALASFSTVAICQQMIYAIAKPPIAKLSDVFGRAEALVFSLALYASGYAIVATAQSMTGIIGGIMLQAAGNTGVQVLQSIIIADLTTAKWRGLVISLVNIPYLINWAAAGPLVDAVINSGGGWRAGYGMWVIIVPLAAAPLVIILLVGQSQARKAGLLARPPIFARGCGSAFSQLSTEIDALGLLLFTLSWTLILGPLTVVGHGSKVPPGVAPAVMVGGLLLLLVFVFCESKAANPIMPLRFLRNRAVVCVCLIGILDFASFYLSWTYISAFVQVVKGWGQTQTGYFATTQNVTSTIFGICIGSLMAWTRRFKPFLVGGAIVRLIGTGMMIRYRNSHDPTIMLVLCQLLQGIGGGSVAITMQIAAQICVPHADVAIVTALELLTTEIGAAIGSATAGLIFVTVLPDRLRLHLGPEISDEEVLHIFGSLSEAVSFPMGSPQRIAIVAAWTETMHRLCITATLLLLPTIPLALLIPDLVLPDTHKKARSHSHTHSHSHSHGRSHSHSRHASATSQHQHQQQYQHLYNQHQHQYQQHEDQQDRMHPTLPRASNTKYLNAASSAPGTNTWPRRTSQRENANGQPHLPFTEDLAKGESPRAGGDTSRRAGEDERGEEQEERGRRLPTATAPATLDGGGGQSALSEEERRKALLRSSAPRADKQYAEQAGAEGGGGHDEDEGDKAGDAAPYRL